MNMSKENLVPMKISLYTVFGSYPTGREAYAWRGCPDKFKHMQVPELLYFFTSSIGDHLLYGSSVRRIHDVGLLFEIFLHFFLTRLVIHIHSCKKRNIIAIRMFVRFFFIYYT